MSEVTDRFQAECEEALKGARENSDVDYPGTEVIRSLANSGLYEPSTRKETLQALQKEYGVKFSKEDCRALVKMARKYHWELYLVSLSMV